MAEGADFSSRIVEAGATGYAAGAAHLLLERHPETAARFGETAFGKWKEHLALRSRQLAAALLVAEPALFVADVTWSRTSFESRDVPLADLLASLECLRDTLAAELPEGSRELPRRYLEASLEALAAAPPPAAPEPAGRTPGETLALRLLEATLAGDRRRAKALVLEAIGESLSVRAAYTEVLAVTQRMAGDLWHAGALSVPQEHFVTATVRDVMAVLADRAPRAEPRGLGALLAVAPGNGHELAARALADLLEIDGWRTVYLGGNLPASDLAVALGQFEADLLGLSIALSTQLRGARRAIRLARAAKPEVKILVGGGVFFLAPGLWRHLGADAGAASLDEAVAVAARLCPAR